MVATTNQTVSELKDVNETSQEAFNSNHELYDSVRPSYPEDAVELAVELTEGRQIAEVAAGTGKFTREILKAASDSHFDAVHYTAIEPSSGMLESFKKNFPHIKTVQASASALPFEDSTFTTIYIAQAFHWFSTRESLTELNRVLVPGGRLILIWNYEDTERFEKDGWQSKTTHLFWDQDNNVPQYRHNLWQVALSESADLFTMPFHSRTFPYAITVPSKEFLWEYWSSRSYITTLPKAKLDELKAEFDKIMENAPEKLVARRGTHVVWMRSTKQESRKY